MLDAAETEIYSQQQRRHVFITLSLPFSQDAAETEIDSQAKTIAGKRAELNRRHSQRKAHSLLIRGIGGQEMFFNFLASLFYIILVCIQGGPYFREQMTFFTLNR